MALHYLESFLFSKVFLCIPLSESYVHLSFLLSLPAVTTKAMLAESYSSPSRPCHFIGATVYSRFQWKQREFTWCDMLAVAAAKLMLVHHPMSCHSCCHRNYVLCSVINLLYCVLHCSSVSSAMFILTCLHCAGLSVCIACCLLWTVNFLNCK